MRVQLRVLGGLAILVGCANPHPVTSPNATSPPAVHPPTQSSNPDEPLRVGGDVKAPVLISKVDPLYPDEARKAKIQGMVVIEAVISAEGDVTDARVVKSDD